MGGVFHDPHGHGRADEAGHGGYGIVVMAGGEADLTLFNHDAGFLRSLSPAFINDGTDHSPFLGTAHVLPADWRAGVQKHAPFKAGDGLSGRSNPYEYGIGFKKTRHPLPEAAMRSFPREPVQQQVDR